MTVWLHRKFQNGNRLRLDDLDFDAENVLIREKKCTRGWLTTRTVPKYFLLADEVKQWTDLHLNALLRTRHAAEAPIDLLPSQLVGHRPERLQRLLPDDRTLWVMWNMVREELPLY